MKYAKFSIILIAACLLMMPALSMMPDDQNSMMGQVQDCHQQMCDRQKSEMSKGNQMMMPCMKEMAKDGKHMAPEDGKFMLLCQLKPAKDDKFMILCKKVETGKENQMPCMKKEMGEENQMPCMKKEMGLQKPMTWDGKKSMAWGDGKAQMGEYHEHGMNKEGSKEICLCICQNFKIRQGGEHHMGWNGPEIGER